MDRTGVVSRYVQLAAHTGGAGSAPKATRAQVTSRCPFAAATHRAVAPACDAVRGKACQKIDLRATSTGTKLTQSDSSVVAPAAMAACRSLSLPVAAAVYTAPGAAGWCLQVDECSCCSCQSCVRAHAGPQWGVCSCVEPRGHVEAMTCKLPRAP